MFDKLIEEHPEIRYLDEIESQRYLVSRNIKGHKSRKSVDDVKFVENLIKQEDVKSRKDVRMSKSSLAALFDAIKDDNTPFLLEAGNRQSNKRSNINFNISHKSIYLHLSCLPIK